MGPPPRLLIDPIDDRVGGIPPVRRIAGGVESADRRSSPPATCGPTDGVRWSGNGTLRQGTSALALPPKHQATEHHHYAASHHHAAAHHHHQAAHFYEQGDHDEAQKHAAAALEHSQLAQRQTTTAFARSRGGSLQPSEH